MSYDRGVWLLLTSTIGPRVCMVVGVVGGVALVDLYCLSTGCVFCRDAIVGLAGFIRSGRELLVHIMINLRAHYTGFLHSSDPKVVGHASVERTVLGTLDEVRPDHHYR